MFVRSVLSSYFKLLAGASLALMAAALAGCNDTVAEKAEPPRPVLVATVHYAAETPERSFVGTIRPRIESDLGFRVAGKVAKRLVEVGQTVEVGQPLLVYAELAGQGWRRSGDIFRTDLVLDFELRRADGQSLVAQQAFNTIATASRRRNREFFLYVTYSFSGLEPGDYVVRTTVRDRAGNKQTAFDLTFAVRR